jgi:hypothetical protein
MQSPLIELQVCTAFDFISELCIKCGMSRRNSKTVIGRVARGGADKESIVTE